jgi:xyloglucan:xyloglucosyl transferase
MLAFCVSLSSSSKFDELFQPSWALDHFVYEGNLLKLKLDNSSGKSIIFFYINFFQP